MSGCEDIAAYKLDPNYAVICSFLEQFVHLLYEDSVPISIQSLDSFLEAESVKMDNEMVTFHRKLLYGIGNKTKQDQWEKGLIKFSEDFPERDDKLITKLGYSKIPVAAKLRILKNLLEDQFEYNDKFNVKVNKLEETDIRNISLGTDRQGRTYWYIMDKNGSIRLYRSFRDDFTCQETWRLLCSNADELKDLIEFLETYGDIDVDPKLPEDRAIPPSKLIFKKMFLKITENDVEDIVADTKNPNQIYYNLPKARTSIQIDRDEKKNKLKHSFIKLSAEDKTPADVSLEKLREEIKLEKLAGNTEKAGSTEISNEIEEASETEDVGEINVDDTEDRVEMKDDVKSLKVVEMENEKRDKESKTEKADRTFKLGKTGKTSETEDTSEIEEVNEMRNGEKGEEESDIEEADNTETADEAEGYLTEQTDITEKAGKLQDASEMEGVSEIRDIVKREEESDMEEVDNTETADEAEEGYKTEQIGITEKAGKIQEANEIEDASEVEGENKIRDVEKREEESDMVEADNTETADDAEEECVTKNIGKSEKAEKTVKKSETEQGSETGEAIRIGKAGTKEKAVVAKEAVNMEKIGNMCEKEEIGVIIENKEKKCKESNNADAICQNNLEIGNSQVFHKDELCRKGKDTDLNRKEKQGTENKTETDNSDTREDNKVSACEEVKQKEIVDLQKNKEDCGSVESVKDNTQNSISIGTEYDQDILVSNNEEDQDSKDKSCSLNGESSIEANQRGIKFSDVILDRFEDDRDLKETLMRISELSGAYIGSKSHPDIGKKDTQSTKNNANDLLQVSDESNTSMTSSLSIEKGESDKSSAIGQHSKEIDTKAFDEALEGLKTLEEIISQGNAILGSGESMKNKLEKDKRLYDKLLELKSAISSSESSKDTFYQDDMINKDKHETGEQTSKIGEQTLICDKINYFQSGKEAEASDSVSKNLDDMIKSLKSCSNTSLEPEIPVKIEFGHKEFGHKEFDLNKAKISEQVLDEKQHSKVKLQTQQDAIKKELKVELERIDEIFKRKKQDMNDLVKVFNCDRLDVKQRNSPVKSIPVCSVKEEKNSHILESYAKSESVKSRGGLRSQMVVDKKPGTEVYSYIVKDENNVEIVQPTKDGKVRSEDEKYKDASILKTDTDEWFGFESLLDDKLKGFKVDQTSAIYKMNGHKSPVHELRNETVTENERKSPEVVIVETVSSDKKTVNERNKAESSVDKSKEESSEKTVKMIVDGDIIEINELSSSSETEEQGDDMNVDKTVQENSSYVKIAPKAIEKCDIKSNLEHAYSSLDRSKRLAKEALKVNRERMSMGNMQLRDKPKTMDKIPLVTPTRVPLNPTKLVPLSATAASQKIILTSSQTKDNLLPLTSIVPVSTAAPKTTVVFMPQSNVQLLQKSGVSFLPQSNVKIVPQSNVKIVPQSNVKIVPQSNIRIVPKSSVQGQSSIVPQSSVKKPTPPAPVCRSLLQNSNKSSTPTSPAVSSKFVTVSPSNSSMTLPISTSSGLSPSGQYLNKGHNTVNPASREGNFSEKLTGSQVLHPDMGRKIVVGPGMKCYDAETGLDVNIKLTGNTYPCLRPGSTFYLIKKLTSYDTSQNKEQHGVPQTVSNLNQNALVKNPRIRWREPRTSKVRRGRRSARGRGRGRAIEILDESSDSEEFVPMDSDDSDYDYDSLSRHIHEAAKKERKFEMRLPRFLQDGCETDEESSKRERRQKKAINYNEDIEEVSDSDVDVETVQEKVVEYIKPKPPEKFELMEYPCSICGSSDFFATILTCADCNSTYHMACLTPPLLALPTEDWFCPQCEHEMLVENLKVKYKQLRRLLYSIDRRNNKINAKIFGICKENIIKVDRSARNRKEVNYDETKFDDMVKSAVKEYNKMEDNTSEEKKSSKTSSVKDSDESDCLSATETEARDNSDGEKEENRQSKEASPEPGSRLRSLRKRPAKNQNSAGCEDTGPTKSKVKKIANGGKVDVKLKGESVNIAGDKQTGSSRQGKELSEESDDSQKRKLGRTARSSTDADSDFALSDSDVIGVDGDSDTEDYEDSTVKKEEPEEHVYYTSSGRKTNSLSKLKNAF